MRRRLGKFYFGKKDVRLMEKSKQYGKGKGKFLL
jgi:hypothetical protein